MVFSETKWKNLFTGKYQWWCPLQYSCNHEGLKYYEKETPSPMFSEKFMKFHRILILQKTVERMLLIFSNILDISLAFALLPYKAGFYCAIYSTFTPHFMCLKYFEVCFMDKSLLRISLFIYLFIYLFICLFVLFFSQAATLQNYTRYNISKVNIQ